MMETAIFKVKTSEFEGPLDLLLSLIEDRKMHISQVSLAQVTDDFIEHTKILGERSQMGETAHFILIASTLILIKSRSLLPTIKLSDEEEASIEELEKRLLLYKHYKELSGEIEKIFGKSIIFARNSSPTIKPVFSPASDLSISNLLDAVKSVLNSLPVPEKIPEAIVKKVISLEEAIGDLTSRIQTAIKMRFSDFVKDKKEKVNVIVSFLGMLEMVKDGILEVRQSADFADIEMENQRVATPRY